MEDMVTELGKNGMSSDSDCDDDNGADAYAARPLVWRNVRVDPLLDELDRVARTLQQRGAKSRKIYRNHQAIRLKGEAWYGRCMVNQPAMPELPEVVYNDKWLANMRKINPSWVEETLRPSTKRLGLLEIEYDL
jgi:hypothetical protein